MLFLLPKARKAQDGTDSGARLGLFQKVPPLFTPVLIGCYSLPNKSRLKASVARRGVDTCVRLTTKAFVSISDSDWMESVALIPRIWLLVLIFASCFSLYASETSPELFSVTLYDPPHAVTLPLVT